MPPRNNPTFEPSGTLSSSVYGALEKLTRPPVLTLLAVLQAIAVAFVGVGHVLDVTGPLSADGSEVAIGDYLPFLTGGTILAQGHGERLYDLAYQVQVEESLAGIKLVDYWQPYLNTPLLAIGMSALADFPFAIGFRLFVIAMIVFGAFGAWAMVRSVPALSDVRWGVATIVALTLSFHPIAVTMFGGQNTVVTLALICGALWALQNGHGLLAGALVGVLSYKPQYVPFIGLLLVWTGSWRAVGAAVAVGLAHYVAGAVFVSPRWPIEMITSLSTLYEVMEGGENAGTHFSLLPFFRYSVGGLFGKTLAAVSIGALALVFVWRAPRVRPGDRDFPLLWSMVLVAGMLVSPHLQWYDFGILILPVAVAIDAMVRRAEPPALALRLAVGIAYVGFPWIYASRTALGFQLLTLLALGLFGWLCWLGRDRGEREAVSPLQ